jgi:hypothetical protein
MNSKPLIKALPSETDVAEVFVLGTPHKRKARKPCATLIGLEAPKSIIL